MKPTEIRKIMKANGNKAVVVEDELITEYESDVWVNGEKSFSLLCTPLDMRELVIGYLITSRIICSAEQIREITIREENICVTLEMTENGECHCSREYCAPAWEQEEVLRVGREVFAGYELFKGTGGTHTAAIVKEGRVLCRFEDIGRHNAIDKAVGWLYSEGMPVDELQLYTSGRVTTAILEKAVNAGIGMIVSHAAATVQAADTAREKEIVLLGFCRGDRFNQYA